MRVLIINNSNSVDGPGNVIKNDINALEKEGILVKQAYFTHFKTGKNSKAFEIEDRKYGIFHNPIYSLYAATKIKKIIEEFKPDIAHLHIFYGKFTPSIINVLLKMNVKIIQTVHDSRYICQKNDMYRDGQICTLCTFSSMPHGVLNNCNQSITKTLMNYLEKQLLFFSSKYIEKILFVSKTQRDQHILKSQKKFKKSQVIYNSIEKISQEPVTIPSDGIVNLLILSRIVDGKGIPQVIDILETEQFDASFKIYVAGAGSLVDLLEERYSHMIENGTLNLEGECSNQRKHDLILKSHVIVAPSLMFETFGLTLLEAAQNKKVLLASNSGAHSEVAHLVNGHVYSSKNELRDLLRRITQLTPSFLPIEFHNETRGKKLKEVYHEVGAK